jgi:hypothetical protein
MAGVEIPQLLLAPFKIWAFALSLSPRARGPDRRSLAVTISLIIAALWALAQAAVAAPPASDPAVDWLLNQATTAPTAPTPTTAPISQPADAPATQPAFDTPATRAPGRPGTLLLSDGAAIVGRIATTPGKPIRLWEESRKQYQDLPLNLIASIEAEVIWERDEPQWHFAASGSDAKVVTGRTYPARLTHYRITLTTGQTFDGAVDAPLTVTTAAGQHTYVLHKRDKGDAGQTIPQLVYVKRVTFDP